MSDTATPVIKRSSSRRSTLTPEQRRRKKTIQIALGIVVAVVVILFAVWAQSVNPRGAFVILIGVGLGYTLQRSRFCFTASLRDPMLTGGTDLTKAVIVALALSSVLFMAINMTRFGLDLSVQDAQFAGNVQPVGIHTALGAFLFGIGAVIAGGCASGTIMRMGEGFAQQWLAFVFFVIGSIIGVALMVPIRSVPFLYSGTRVFLPTALGGWVPAVIVQFGVLLLLYVAADLWGRRRSGSL